MQIGETCRAYPCHSELNGRVPVETIDESYQESCESHRSLELYRISSAINTIPP